MSEFSILGYSFESAEDAELYVLERETHLAIDAYFREYQFDFMMEAGSEDMENLKEKAKNAGSSIGNTIQKAFNSVINMLKQIWEKIQSFFTGNKNPEIGDPKRELNLKSDPKEMVKLTDEVLEEDQSALQRALKGDMTVEEAKEIASNHRKSFNNLKPFVDTAAVVAVPFVAQKLKINQWSKQLSQSLSKNADLIDEISKRNSYSNREGQIKDNRAEAAQIIINDIATTTGESSRSILGIAKSLYIKSEVNKVMNDQENSKKSIIGGAMYRHGVKQDKKAAEKERKKLIRLDRTITANNLLNKLAERKYDKAADKLNDQRSVMRDKSVGISKFDRIEMEQEKRMQDDIDDAKRRAAERNRIKDDVRSRAAEVKDTYQRVNPKPKEKSDYEKAMELSKKARNLK